MESDISAIILTKEILNFCSLISGKSEVELMVSMILLLV